MPINDHQPDFKAMLPTWERIRDFVAGPAAVKAKNEKYLPRLPGHGATFATESGPAVVTHAGLDKYRAYKQRAVVLPFAAPLLSRLVGMLFRKAPTFAVPESMSGDLANIALSAPACNAEGFAKRLARELIQSGQALIAVDYDARVGRAYQRIYNAGSILGVDHVLIGSTAVPFRLRLLETVTEANPKDDWMPREVEQVRVLELAPPPTPELADAAAGAPDLYAAGVLVQSLWRRALDKDGNRTGDWQKYEVTTPLRFGRPLWFLPVVPVNAHDVSFEVGQAPLDVLVELVAHYYLVSADWRQLLHACSGAILFGAGFNAGEEKQIGQFGGLQGIICSDSAAKLELKQVSGESSDQLTACLEELKQNMALAIGRLFMAQQKGVAESGAALELQFSGDDANLQQIGSVVALALEQALRIHAWWNGAGDTPDELADVTANLADSFVARRLSPQELQALSMALESGNFTDLDRYWNLKQAEALDPSSTFETWQKDRGDGIAPSGVDLGEVRASLAALKAAQSAGDASSLAAALRSLDVLIGEDGDMDGAA